jgi:acetyl esterase/lipase
MCIHEGKLYATEFTFRGSKPAAEVKRFDDSLRIGIAASPSSPPVAGGGPASAAGAPAAGGAAPTDSRPYLERRAKFQTKLVKRGKSPQPWENEPLAANVTQVTYPSGSLSLKGWVHRPPQGGPKFPALVFFHGGFAFGMDDLAACRPFMDAGFVVMAPATRGENGNPGDFELFLGEVDDAKAACVWLSQQPYVDASRIYTFGHSVGGGISALLSLQDDVPVRHGGSSGGLYSEATFSQWSDITPFDTSNVEEKQLRILVGNVAHMKRKHFAYLGTTDVAFHPAEARARSEAPGTSLLTLERSPGDHFTSFEPALRKYLEVVRREP